MKGPFSDYKVTEISPDIQEDFFVEPKNISILKTAKASFIYGERGSGKTTILKHLEKVFLEDEEHRFLGVYFRFETANMRSLYTDKFDEEDNIHAFSQYIHAVLCKLICYKLEDMKKAGIMFDERNICRDVCEVLSEDDRNECSCIDTIVKLQKKFESIRKETLFAIRNRKVKYLFEYNCVLERFAQALRENDCFKDTCICVLFDEFENLTVFQQRVINSMIKNSSYKVTYKVFMRPEGVWDFNTLAEREHLQEGDDYVQIDYVKEVLGDEDDRRNMVRKICKNRLKVYFTAKKISFIESDLDIDQYLENQVKDVDISKIENINIYRQELIQNILNKIGRRECKEIENMLDVLKLQLVSIILQKGYSIEEILMNMRQNSLKYQNWKHNYEINAFYIILDSCGQKRDFGGLDIIIRLTNYNTRMILNILSYSFKDYDFFKKKADKKISVQKQTFAINRAAQLTFEQIQYIPADGITVKNFIQALGTLFKAFILDKQAQKFEVNSFDIAITDHVSKADIKKIGTIMKIATIWGILLPDKAKKKKSHTDYSYDNRDYVLHPILCVYFNISYRKKQKHTLNDEEVIAMFEKMSSNNIEKIYRNRRRNKSIEGQLELPINKE